MSASPRQLAELFSVLRERGEDTWNPADPLPEAAVLALRALTIQANALDAARTEVVPIATSPRSATALRRVENALEELIQSAEQEIIVLGYELSDALVIGALARQSALGVTIDLMLDPVQTPMPSVRAAWPIGAPSARLWVTGTDGRGRNFRLHAKAVLVDGSSAMVGSANLTRSGLRGNLELGVLLRGPAVGEIRAYVQQLIRRGILVPAGDITGS